MSSTRGRAGCIRHERTPNWPTSPPRYRDLPAEPTAARPSRDPWRATKIAWRVVYATIVPGIVALVLIPGGPRTTGADVVILAAVVYLIFWILGVSVMVASRHAKRSGGQLPPQSAPGALAGGAGDD